MPKYIPLPASSRVLTPDQRNLSRWFAALLLSGRGPRKVTQLCHELIDAGMSNPSYETLVKAARSVVALPAKYIGHLAVIYDLTDDERAAFLLTGLLAHASPEVVDAYRRYHDLPEVAVIPDLSASAVAV